MHNLVSFNVRCFCTCVALPDNPCEPSLIQNQSPYQFSEHTSYVIALVLAANEGAAQAQHAAAAAADKANRL